MHKTLALASTLLLAACDQPDITDLSTLAIPGVKPINYRAHDPAYFLTLNTTFRIRHNCRAYGAQNNSVSTQLVADEGVSDDAIAAAVDKALGDNWQRSDKYTNPYPQIRVMAWETKTTPRRCYAIVAWQQPFGADDGQRLLRNVYTLRNTDPGAQYPSTGGRK